MSEHTEHAVQFNGRTLRWDGDLEEGTIIEIEAGDGTTTSAPLYQLIAMTNGAVLDALDT